MEKLKKSRSLLRASVTKVASNLNALMASEEKDLDKIQVTFKLLESKCEGLRAADTQFMELSLEGDASEEDLLADSAKADEYVCLCEELRLKVQKLIQTNSDAVSVSSVNSQAVSIQNKRRFKLPQIELKKFDSNMLNWLPFWSQFSKIHDDPDIVAEDKFQYLLQSVVPGTRAFDLIESFPPTAANYIMAIEGLKARFGKNDLLVEVYVRELLKLVLQNALDGKIHTSLQNLYDKLESHLRALETLGVTTDRCASILYPLVESCMPEDLLRAWQRSTGMSGDDPKDRLDKLMKFMLSEVEGEQRIGLAMSGFGVGSSGYSKEKPVKKLGQQQPACSKLTPSAASLVSSIKTQNVSTCLFCDKSHKSADCFLAQKMSLAEKQKIVREKNCCYCCLQPGHSIKRCKSNLKCPLCKRRHLLIMCPNLLINQEDTSKTVSKECTKPDNDNVLSSNPLKGSPKVFMQTVVANLRNPNTNEMRPVRVLFDTGSQRSYVLENLAKKIGYESVGEETIVHSLFGNVKSDERRHKRYRVYLSNLENTYKCNFEAIDQPTICGDISHITPGPWMTELEEKHIKLTDVENTSLPISLLIGADIAGKLFTGKRQQLESGLVAMETLIGWTIMGKVSASEENNSYLSSVVTSMFIKEADVSELWKLESIGIRDSSEQLSDEKRALCVQKCFLDTTIINDEGRYEVDLPWIDGHQPLPSNKGIAEKRLLTCAGKLEKINLFTEYDSIFKQWQQDGIIELVPANEIDRESHYLPHRPVVKESSATTRIRPVFDASAKNKYSPSLNDCLERGPNLIELIPSVLLRFREGKYGAIADIAKAFLQISINPRDRDYLRFLWYSNVDMNEIIEYRHRRVVFGAKCSPYLLGATIDLHLKSCLVDGSFNPDVINKLMKSFYVDNVSTSVDTELELNMFMKESIDVMNSGKFDLRGWKLTGDFDAVPEVNVLGIQWNFEKDVLSLNTECLKEFDISCVTRRKILSIAHRIFDPIGFVSPVMLHPKILLQKTWNEEGVSWDTELNEDISNEFRNWFAELSSLEGINFPRWIGKTVTSNSGCSIHTFCDGSSLAYATVIFLRTEVGSHVTIQLIAARSRVSPAKQTTIPRMELLAALMGARLTKSVLDAMEWENIPIYYWTDSSTVLAWIKEDKNWSVFVLNRVSEIRRLTMTSQWNHIPGKENPADLPSRGCNATQLAKLRWWEGPQWMKNPIDTWPTTDISHNEEEITAEMRKTKTLSMTNCLENDQSKSFCEIFTKYSDYMKMIRVFAWTYRFVNNCRSAQTQRSHEEITSLEIGSAEKKLLMLVQQETLTDFKKISPLCPFLHEDGLIRLKTKLSKKDDTFDFRYPILLPAKHKVVESLITYHHKKNCHAGLQILMNILREEYWIIGGRRSIRAVLSKCVICKRQKAKRMEAPTATLPVDRLKDASIFEVTGTDFAGPIHLKNGEKAWICIFTCAVFRAVHMELVTSLSTEEFLQAFRRFIARRGRPSIMYSDNGTNYVGAHNALQQINWKNVEKYSSAQRIHWKFSPPSAPWWGGWWERMVRLIKELLRRVLGKASLNYQEMSTILCDCEAVINSRPLTYTYDGESDLIPLSPNHFLQEIREYGVPDIDRIDEVNLNKRLKYLQSLRLDLRKRFRKEYLGQLVHRCKTSQKSRRLEVGEVVLLECENLKRVDWPLAIVVDVLPDKDGTVRLARVRTQNRVFLRPVQRLYSLEVTSKEDLVKEDTTGTKTSVKQENKRSAKKSDDGQPEVKTRSGRVVNTPLKYKTLFSF